MCYNKVEVVEKPNERDWGLSRLIFLDACIDFGFAKRPRFQLLMTAVIAFVFLFVLVALLSA